ncbi:hypothetical protein K6V90_24470 [Cupriavidus pauculus]|uniref:hypothetical protein n=1 Tax=Cupriavidus pauculus TaxID=82633 RepID=UPI001C934C2C|nr:hypothetical protein [Cupriavidus pauculus]MBY4733696.1 hypothetical protein [Cupriavidus pauculus]
MTTYHKSDIARAQLETAVDVFLRGLSHHSVITLAGAASGILTGLVHAAGKETFVDYARRVHEGLQGSTPKRDSYAHHIEKAFGISAHKHLSETDSDSVELDVEELAANALGRAIADYVTLNGRDEPFVKAYLQWAWVNKDGPEIMKMYDAVPKKLRRRS